MQTDIQTIFETAPLDEILGSILHLQRLSTEDGPGIRTTVFFKGCPLHCVWCHNPESIKSAPELEWLENRCIGCNTCLGICPQKGLTRDDSGLHINREKCTGCGDCAEACPANAIEKLGKEITVEKLVAELRKDRAYYDKSGGGVTLSGGEPTRQFEFSRAVLTALQQEGIATALDTCGMCSRETLQTLLQHSDLVLYDLKILDQQLHRQLTGADNTRILENLRWLCETLKALPNKKLWIRTPLIPNATFTEENIIGLSTWLAENTGDSVNRWELCAFNNLCRDKYSRLGLKWDFASTPLMSAADLAQAGTWARSGGFDTERIFVTGTAKLEEQ